MLGFHLLDLLVIPCLNTLSPDSLARLVASRVNRDSVTCPLLGGTGLWSGKDTGWLLPEPQVMLGIVQDRDLKIIAHASPTLGFVSSSSLPPHPWDCP